jgi:phage-related protein
VAKHPFKIEFYETADEVLPVRDWLMSLQQSQRRAVGKAMEEILQRDGVGVCGTEFGKQLGQGLFEFRVRASSADILRPGERDANPWKMVVRIFCHAHGDRLVLLLSSYDKAKDPSPRRQQREIALARERLADWKRRTRT